MSWWMWVAGGVVLLLVLGLGIMVWLTVTVGHDRQRMNEHTEIVWGVLRRMGGRGFFGQIADAVEIEPGGSWIMTYSSLKMLCAEGCVVRELRWWYGPMRPRWRAHYRIVGTHHRLQDRSLRAAVLQELQEAQGARA